MKAVTGSLAMLGTLAYMSPEQCSDFKKTHGKRRQSDAAGQRSGNLLFHSPFYMDSRKVSNFLFVEFLNNLKDKLAVQGGVVRLGKTMVISIGDGSAPEDRIMYRHGMYHLKNQEDGDQPVLRVTFHGAHLYAATYQRDLLTPDQWRFAYNYFLEHPVDGQQADSQSSPETETHVMMHSTAPTPAAGPVVLDHMGLRIKEWVRIPHPPAVDKNGTVGAMAKPGVIDATDLTGNKQPLKRYPWEAFGDVGFRTMVPVIEKQQGSK